MIPFNVTEILVEICPYLTRTLSRPIHRLPFDSPHRTNSHPTKSRSTLASTPSTDVTSTNCANPIINFHHSLIPSQTLLGHWRNMFFTHLNFTIQTSPFHRLRKKKIAQLSLANNRRIKPTTTKNIFFKTCTPSVKKTPYQQKKPRSHPEPRLIIIQQLYSG